MKSHVVPSRWAMQCITHKSCSTGGNPMTTQLATHKSSHSTTSKNTHPRSIHWQNTWCCPHITHPKSRSQNPTKKCPSKWHCNIHSVNCNHKSPTISIHYLFQSFGQQCVEQWYPPLVCNCNWVPKSTATGQPPHVPYNIPF